MNWANLKTGELGMEGLGVGVGVSLSEDDEEELDSFSDEGVNVAGVAAGSNWRLSLRSRWSDGHCDWCSIGQRGGAKADTPRGGWE